MEIIPKPIRQRMPQDLLQYVLKQKTVADIPVCEQDPADVAFEVISAGSFEIKHTFHPLPVVIPWSSCIYLEVSLGIVFVPATLTLTGIRIQELFFIESCCS